MTWGVRSGLVGHGQGRVVAGETHRSSKLSLVHTHCARPHGERIGEVTVYIFISQPNLRMKRYGLILAVFFLCAGARVECQNLDGDTSSGFPVLSYSAR